MKQIKVFKTINQSNINKFLKETNGAIVSYNPIIIEYELNDKKVLPTVTHKGYGFLIEVKSDISLYDWGAKLETMKPVYCNEVLFFSEKIVFLSDGIERFSIETKETWRGAVHEAYLKDSNKPIYVDIILINERPISLGSIPEFLNEINVPAVENHIAYNERTKLYEYVGKLKSKAIVKNGELIKEGLNDIAGGIRSISNMNKRIHNAKMNRKKI